MGQLQTFDVPVEIYIIFLQNPEHYFSISEMRAKMLEIHDDDISKDRVRQIMNGLADRGRIKKETRKHPVGTKVMCFYALFMDYPEQKETKETAPTENGAAESPEAEIKDPVQGIPADHVAHSIFAEIQRQTDIKEPTE